MNAGDRLLLSMSMFLGVQRLGTLLGVLALVAGTVSQVQCLVLTVLWSAKGPISSRHLDERSLSAVLFSRDRKSVV